MTIDKPGSSLVGKAPALGAGERRFKSCLPDRHWNLLYDLFEDDGLYIIDMDGIVELFI